MMVSAVSGRLASKIIHVTGACGGIGQAIMARIRSEGGIAVGSDVANSREAALALDVTDEAHWAKAAAWITARYGALDGLVNAAGIVVAGSVEETDFATWRRVLAVNLDGVFLGCRAMLPLMRSRGGSIVNLSSVSGLVGGHNLAAYNAAKGGVRMLTKSVALHGARLVPPVRCNSVHPAFVAGPMVDGLLSTARDWERAAAKMKASIPLGRFGEAGEVAALVAYLLSEESGFCTGSEFKIDGGLTA